MSIDSLPAEVLAAKGAANSRGKPYAMLAPMSASAEVGTAIPYVEPLQK